MNAKCFSIKNNMLDTHVQVPQWYGYFYHNNSIKLKKYLLSIRIQISSDMNFIVMLYEALKKNKLISNSNTSCFDEVYVVTSTKSRVTKYV